MSTQKPQAIVFEAPQRPLVQTLELKTLEAGDLEVAVGFRGIGIGTGTERLLWDGSMPPLPSPGYPRVPGSYNFLGVLNIFGGAACWPPPRWHWA